MIFVGIDIAKARVDCAILPSGQRWREPRTSEGLQRLAERLMAERPTIVVLEATGGLERSVVNALAQHAVPFAVINPRQVRDFARATGRLAKTDALDADVLARFAQAVRPEPQSAASPEQQKLQTLCARRRQLVAFLIAEKNHLSALPEAAVDDLSGSLERHISELTGSIDAHTTAMAASLSGDPEWSRRAKLLRTIPGVGPVTTNALMAGLPELGALNRKRIAALCGVAPFNRDSGTFRGKRSTWGGRADVRTALYMSALAAIRLNPSFAVAYQRLVQAGKPKKVALTACMRKLVVLANAVVKSGRPYSTSGPAASLVRPLPRRQCTAPRPPGQ